MLLLKSRSGPEKRLLRLLYGWITPVFDPLRAWRAGKGLIGYFMDCRRYSRLPGAEPLKVSNLLPMLHDRTGTTSIDAHYFHVSGWAMRRITANRPPRHVDVGSLALFANLLGAVIPVTFVDYRPLEVRSEGLVPLAGDLLALPFADGSVPSLSCLHVAEHVGLGRYGDTLDPAGTVKAARELARVLKDSGNLYFAVPVGRPRVCFNAHRVHRTGTIREYFSSLELVELSGVHDDGRFVQGVDLCEFDEDDYACGMFWFRKTQYSE